MPLNQPYDDSNIFAKILRGEIPNMTIYEDADVLSFMDIFPQSEGHCLVIPKREHAINLLDMPAERLGVLIQKTQMIAKAVHKALAPDGIRLMQFNGSEAGQTVFHLHFHIIPVYKDKSLAPHAGGQANMDELKDLAARIKAQL